MKLPDIDMFQELNSNGTLPQEGFLKLLDLEKYLEDTKPSLLVLSILLGILSGLLILLLVRFCLGWS